MAIALSEICQGLQTIKTITLLNSNNRNSIAFNEFIMEIHRRQLETCIFNDTLDFFKFIEMRLKGSLDITALIFDNPDKFIKEIHNRNLAHRLSLFIFYWNAKHLSSNYKLWNLHDPLRAVFITNPRYFVYRIYYNQALSSNDGTLKLVNWYDGNSLGLQKEPLLPDIKSVHKTFNGRRHFIVPVIHSPPWIFIHKSLENSEEFRVSGRDDTLLKLLAEKMNFHYDYIDVKMIEIDENVTVTGSLGFQMLQRREADFVFGDTVVTYERMQEVEFSFFTLPDSGAFLTHAPRRLSEAFALVHPFQKEVWPALFLTLLISGPILYLMIAIPECTTYKLARPSKELPIDSLQRLEFVLNRSKGAYKLLVERNSASHSVLMNGTGIMQRLYHQMTQQSSNSYLLNSVEQGVRRLLINDKTVVFAGRQTLYFNMKRYGARNFQLSDKLFTRYSAISLQKGCLFLDSLNENLMKLFEAGILDKITNDEYEKMFQSMQTTEDDENQEIEGIKNVKNTNEKELTALSLQMLQGAFYLALIGYSLAFLVLLLEIGYERMTLRHIWKRIHTRMMRINRFRLW
ncbi:hypothetical protein PVAND_008559 [Polypedilum vanderplanki]|uniref:Uncharacterized protein n=1 Tax=Polypedilum vanderplanki TaxID=319348 RepID=A0A9J6C9Y0_POLVA|nr:hypothetical protein PVAND_008559 [Polypedilum vanderplanki]